MYRMVIIDDEEYTCEGLKKIVDWNKYDIEIAAVATNGAEGYKVICEMQPDIVITDISMPVEDGLDMLEKLRCIGYDGEVIVLTGYRFFDYAKKAIDNHVSHYLLKPINIDELINAITEVKNRLSEKKPNTVEKSNETTVMKVVKYIDEHYCENISLKDLSHIYFGSEYYISRKFKRDFGKKFSVYIMEKRISKACELLKQSDFSIEEIVYLVGYQDIKYFRQIFKTNVGMTPREYRKYYRE